MTQANVLPIIPHEAVSQVPRFPACPPLVNFHDIGVLVDIHPKDLGFVRDLLCNKLAYMNGCEHWEGPTPGAEAVRGGQGQY
jgi:hypothetical protein